MKETAFLLYLLFFSITALPQENDSIFKTFHFTHGMVRIGNNIGKITVPKGYKFLNELESKKMITEYLQLPEIKDMTLGMLFKEQKSKKSSSPEEEGNFTDDPFCLINFQYLETGHIKENLADPNSEGEFLRTNNRNDEEDPNFLTWVVRPIYNKKDHKLIGSKEEGVMVMGIYDNIVYLGRNGIFILNIIVFEQDFNFLDNDQIDFMRIFTFCQKNKYRNFKSSTDRRSSIETIEELIKLVENNSPFQ